MAYYLDASIPIDVSRALSLVRDDIEYPGKAGCPVTEPSAKDEVWLPIAGKNDWIVLMRDKHIRTRPGERAALLTSGVRAFVMTGGGNYSKWRTLDLLVRRWSEIEAVAASQAGPYICSVTQVGVARLFP